MPTTYDRNEIWHEIAFLPTNMQCIFLGTPPEKEEKKNKPPTISRRADCPRHTSTDEIIYVHDQFTRGVMLMLITPLKTIWFQGSSLSKPMKITFTFCLSCIPDFRLIFFSWDKRQTQKFIKTIQC